MRNAKKVFKNTDNSRVYKMANRETFTSCPICSPNKGCNRKNRWGGMTSWKKIRKTQWR